jgi:hypothetical protein
LLKQNILRTLINAVEVISVKELKKIVEKEKTIFSLNTVTYSIGMYIRRSLHASD